MTRSHRWFVLVWNVAFAGVLTVSGCTSTPEPADYSGDYLASIAVACGIAEATTASVDPDPANDCETCFGDGFTFVEDTGRKIDCPDCDMDPPLFNDAPMEDAPMEEPPLEVDMVSARFFNDLQRDAAVDLAIERGGVLFTVMSPDYFECEPCMKLTADIVTGLGGLGEAVLLKNPVSKDESQRMGIGIPSFEGGPAGFPAVGVLRVSRDPQTGSVQPEIIAIEQAVNFARLKTLTETH